jgi:hypothetical protein
VRGKFTKDSLKGKYVAPRNPHFPASLRSVKERRSLSYIITSPSPCQGEGDKGDRVIKIKVRRLINNLYRLVVLKFQVIQ